MSGGLGLLADEPDMQEDFGRDQFIEKRRGTAVIDEVFGGSGVRDVVETKMSGQDPKVVKQEQLPEDEFNTFRDRARDVGTKLRGPNQNGYLVSSSQIQDVPDPREVHTSRSEEAQQQDERLFAPLTNDPETYAQNPDEYDWPGVDTPIGAEASKAESLEDFESLF